MTARVARLALAIATISLKLSIWGSRRNCGAPPDSEIALATRVASRALVAPAARNAANHSRGPGGIAGVAMAWKIDKRHDRREAELGDVERPLHARLLLVDEERQARPDEEGEQVLGRGQEEQAEDARQLAQRERMPLAQEMDLDDVRLAEVEREGGQRPRDRERDRQRGDVAHDGRVQDRGDRADEDG